MKIQQDAVHAGVHYESGLGENEKVTSVMLLPAKAEVAWHLGQYRAWERLLLSGPADRGVRKHFEDSGYTLCVLMGERTARLAADTAERYLGLRQVRRRRVVSSPWPPVTRGRGPCPVRPSAAKERSMTRPPRTSPAPSMPSAPAASPAPEEAPVSVETSVSFTVPILDVGPAVDRGRRPVKAVPGETFQVTATLFGEGDMPVGAEAVLTGPDGRSLPCVPLHELAPGTDRWGADVTPDAEGRWTYAVEAWADPVAGWRRSAEIKVPAGIDADVMLEEGALLYERAADGVPHGGERRTLLDAAEALRDELRSPAARLEAALTPRVDEVLSRHPLRERVTRSHALPLLVERRRALFGSWYEFFPRSEGAVVREGEPAVSGTFRTAAERLPA
ncbi:maltotransferase domain-containing protein, partial [Streptomyces sp. MZ04]|uniref:maltotransferase domain-containing protein n=1 Tax=Streptomyces sp. MZ04 TaxID=2559236 RepID=UPI00107E96D3